jgi:predicted DNA-binding protein (UPF0251 family)
MRRQKIDADLVSAPIKFIDTDLDLAICALNMGAEKQLTRQEGLAFQLVVRESMTFQDASDFMTVAGNRRVSRSAVQIYVKRAAKKLRQFCRDHMNAVIQEPD